MKSVKIVVLHVMRALGLFALAQQLTRHRLRILCYHGFAIGDEYSVAPFMFMRPETFARRMQVLKKRGLPVLSLDEAVTKFRKGEIRNAETVITFDDGWETNLTIAVPVLKQHNYPSCIYITTEHLAASTEVFNVVLSYMVHRSTRSAIILKDFHPAVDGTYDISKDKNAGIFALINAAEKAFALPERQQFLHPLAEALGFNLDEVLRNGRFRLLERSQILQLFNEGIDIQLHSHTHRLPADNFESTAAEINANRAAIRDIIGSDQNHFCYPSGVYGPQHPQWLTQLGIASATTCDTGLNGPETSPLLLKRYLDRDDSSDIEFEAEVAGVRELGRRARRIFM